MKLKWIVLLLLFSATSLLAEDTENYLETALNEVECDCHSSKSHKKHHPKRNNTEFAYFYTNIEPVILFGEKIPFNHKTIHTSRITRNFALNEIIFHETGSYMINYTVTAKRVAVQTGTHTPLSTLSGGFLVGLFHYDILSGITVEIPGTRYGVLTEFEQETERGIETAQLFAQVIVKIRSAGSRISLRSLTPAIVTTNTTSAMQLQTRVSNPDFALEPNVSASVTIQKL